MRNKLLLFVFGAILLNGCGILPYKTEFDCAKAPGGHCGSLTNNIKEAYELAGLTNNSQAEGGTVNYEINEVTLCRGTRNYSKQSVPASSTVARY